MNKVYFYAANTVDGYISSDEQNPLSYLDEFNLKIEKMDDESFIKNSYSNFSKDVDIYIIGRRTYEDVNNMDIDYLYKDHENYVVTNFKDNYEDPNVTQFIDYNELLNIIENNKDKKIYIVGGSVLFSKLLDDQKIDNIIITILPVLLGGGTPYFSNDSKINLKLDNVLYDDDFVELHYTVLK